MQEITFEREIEEGVTFYAKVEGKLDQNGKLKGYWKTSTEKNKYNEEGWFYTSGISMKNGQVVIGTYSLKIAGKKVDGVRVTDEGTAARIIALNAQLQQEREARIEQYKRDLQAGSGVVRITKIGSDWPHLAVYPQQSFEDEVGYSAAYRALETALRIENASVVNDEVKEGEYTVAQLELVAPELYTRIMKAVAAHAAEEKARRDEEEYLRASGKTLVRVHHCLECGTWQILGGKSGRLPYEQWQQARDELGAVQRQKYDAQSNGGKEIMSSISMKNDTSRLFDLETAHFVYRVVSADMDSHGC